MSLCYGLTSLGRLWSLLIHVAQVGEYPAFARLRGTPCVRGLHCIYAVVHGGHRGDPPLGSWEGGAVKRGVQTPAWVSAFPSFGYILTSRVAELGGFHVSCADSALRYHSQTVPFTFPKCAIQGVHTLTHPSPLSDKRKAVLLTWGSFPIDF